MDLTYITALSVLFQVTAAALALRLIRISGSRTTWILICLSILGMAVRRSITLYRELTGMPAHPLDLPFEIIGLVTSLFMLAGIFFIATLFESIRRKDEERMLMIRDLQEAVANVRTLSGLLPICASCKKIRDDKGYWNRIEEYIRSRTEAEFSHSICPECRKKLYPEFNR